MNLPLWKNTTQRKLLDIKHSVTASEYVQNLILLKQIILLMSDITHHMPNNYSYDEKMELIEVLMCFKDWENTYSTVPDNIVDKNHFIEYKDNFDNIYSFLCNVKQLTPEERHQAITNAWLSTVRSFLPY